MREIKFRAWDKTGQIMFVPIGYSYIDGYLTCISEAKRTMQNDVTEHLDETWYEDYREPRYSDGKSEIILMQFTGLKDKNGKEIYEGDIVNYGNYTDNDKPCNEEIIFENCSFVGREIRKFGDKNAVSMIGKDCEVIGNIYENPDLLT
jgi:uncharacterized phage protein (TIGR01671 family)